MTQADRMQAAIVTAPGAIDMATVPRPSPGPGEVLVRLEGCGVCASNLEPWGGTEWMHYPVDPGALGHEGWGRIVAAGAGVAGMSGGERVALLGERSFAEYDVVAADAIVPLPPALDGKPFPGEAFGCAMNIFRRAGIRAGQTVAIIGIGFLGAILTRLASDAGARVIAISRRQEMLDFARDMGAIETIRMADHQKIIDEVSALTGGRQCDRVIEAVGKQWPLDLAGEIVGYGGRLVIAGYHQDGPRQVNMQMWNWKGIDVVNAHERDLATRVQGMREAVEAVATGQLDVERLCTHSYSLVDLAEALDATRDKPSGFVKAVIRYD